MVNEHDTDIGNGMQHIEHTLVLNERDWPWMYNSSYMKLFTPIN